MIKRSALAASTLAAALLLSVAGTGKALSFTDRGPQATATPRSGFVLPIATPAPALARATPRPAASPTPVPTPAPSALLPPLYYQAGPRVYAAYPDGSGAVLVATLPASATIRPQLLPDGRLLYPTNAAGTTFATTDRYGRLSGIRTPDLYAGESVWTVAPAPDGRTLAWQLFAPLGLPRYTLNTGVGRVVLTERFGGRGTTVLTTRADARAYAVQALLGWRPNSPYGSGGATLLLQDLYGAVDPANGLTLNTPRGLLEYDPAIADVVNDYLPPLSSDAPGQRALTVSADGAWMVYGDANALPPSGEGPPLAQRVDALNLNTNSLAELDTSRRYPTSEAVTTTRRRTVGKRVVTTRITTGTLRIYQYFSHNAYVAPGDGHALYTLLTVSYPPGARVPRMRSTRALVATPDGKSRTVIARDAQGEGWIDARTAVVARADGLYSVNIASSARTKLASGAFGQMRFIGMRAR